MVISNYLGFLDIFILKCYNGFMHNIVFLFIEKKDKKNEYITSDNRFYVWNKIILLGR